MSGLDYLLHPDGLTAETYCSSYPCIRLTNIFDPDAEDVTIAEPTTMFTDYLLMAELLIISVLLLRSRNVVTWDPVLGRNVVTRGSWRDSPIRNQFWAAGCFLLALSFAAGGTEHGFALYLKCDGRDQCIGSSWVWVATLLLQTPGLALPVIGTAHLVLSRESCWVRVAQAYGAAIVVVFSALVVVSAVSTPLDGYFLSFLNVIAFSVPSILIVLVLACLPLCCRRPAGGPARSAALFLAGWIVCIVSLAWQASGIGVHEHFNHNDIFHSIFFVGLAVVAAGLLARVAEDRRQAEDELKGVQV